ncbi:S-adenosyl-L-methionine-dependent methyltransferase, partial [Halteromyces radiatus]|uniref:S-adenosyl-L-methionine-dependent methyltransferase n=1 Tax=Halteromyces radiatus TaxID=101107 RepID=UPI00221FACE9
MTDIKKDPTDWEERWQLGNTQWDAGKSSPALVTMMQDEEAKQFIPSNAIGIVPGCGSGYDVKYLATPTRHMVGLDMSKTAVEHCQKLHPDATALNYEFIQDDFFKFSVPEQGFDLAYDYTFFCALPPIMREDWATRYGEIIKQGGILICLMFPIEEKEGGPPYGVSEQAYKDVLSSNFDLVYLKDAIGHESRIGREKISIWKRK